jgi:hypothetical protein
VNVIQSDKAARFGALQDGPGTFIIPNPRDVGSARGLAGVGFQALATSSAASASALGRRDGGMTRDAKGSQPCVEDELDGAGVEPDVKVSAADALTTAEKLAAEKIQAEGHKQ